MVVTVGSWELGVGSWELRLKSRGGSLRAGRGTRLAMCFSQDRELGAMRAPSATRLASLVYGFAEGLAHQRLKSRGGFLRMCFSQDKTAGSGELQYHLTGVES
jgi:hypothetical protein